MTRAPCTAGGRRAADTRPVLLAALLLCLSPVAFAQAEAPPASAAEPAAGPAPGVDAPTAVPVPVEAAASAPASPAVEAPVAAPSAPADVTPPAAADATLPAVTVSGERPPEGRRLSTGAPATTIDAAEIEQRQPATIFDVVKTVPGVSVDGGPRATGMKFNVRGFRGNEDVLFKIDGAVKGFEKYRFGSGVFIEPELIKSVTVERSPSVLTGAGAVGGAVLATTKTAADLLRPGQRAGGLLKFGFDGNSHERLWMGAAYGRPTDQSDLLVSLTRRDSGDIKLASGRRMRATANSINGSLLKLGVFVRPDLHLELSRTAFTSGPTYTPYDANSSNAFVGGYVHQSIDDETLNLQLKYQPVDSWIKLRGTLAREVTDLDNLMLTGAGESSFTVPCGTPCVWNAVGGATGWMEDSWKYRIWTGELLNDTAYRLGPVSGVVTVGMQWVDNRRDLRRQTENPLMNGPDGRYPGGFDGQQPPGTRSSQALIGQATMAWADLTLTPGLRVDRYRLTADGAARDVLEGLGEASSYRFRRWTPNLMLAWQPGQGPWQLSYGWRKAFRPPLITDHFATGAASPCSGFFSADGEPIAPNGCGDRLAPTHSIAREVALAWAPAQAGGTDDGAGLLRRLMADASARLSYFRIASTRLVGASYLAVSGDRIVQPYSEDRHGLEFEATYERPQWYGQLNVARIWANRRNGLTGVELPFTAGIPGTTANLSLGWRPLDSGRLELGYHLRQQEDQIVLFGATELTASTQSCGRLVEGGVAQGAVTLQDAFVAWKPTERVRAQLSVHNLFNKNWCSNGDELGNVIGLQGPGRSVRFALTVQI